MHTSTLPSGRLTARQFQPTGQSSAHAREQTPAPLPESTQYPSPHSACESHGSPNALDTHVTNLWYGAGIRPAIRGERVGVDDIAPTLAGLLGVPVPNNSPGRRLL